MVKGMDAILYLYTGGGFFLSGKNRGRFLEDRLHSIIVNGVNCL